MNFATSKNESMIITWCTVMKRLRLSAQATARTLVRSFEPHKPLTKKEAAKVQLALENSGVHQASSRLAAGFARLVLTQITDEH